jgi:hypothetical protein
MTHMRRVRTIACVLLAITLVVTLLGGSAFATSANDRRKIVSFVAGTPLSIQETVIALSGSSMVHILSLINALAIQLPALTDPYK